MNKSSSQSEIAQRASIAVVMPNYNHAHYLHHALSALERQTRAPDEIIIIDDASTDDSVAIIESWRKRMPQLRLLRNSQNLGVNKSTNIGVEAAASRYVACTAADDWLEPAFIARMTALAESFPHAPLCMSEYVQFDEAQHEIVRFSDNSEESCWFAPHGPAFIDADKVLSLLSQRMVWLPLNAAIVKRETFLAVGGLDSSLNWHSDWFATYVTALREGFAVTPEPLAVFRVTAGSFSAAGMRDWDRQVATCSAILDKLSRPEFRDVYKRLAAHPAPLAPFLRAILAASLRRSKYWGLTINVGRWWLKEVFKGRRPGPIKRLFHGSMGHVRMPVEAWRHVIALSQKP